MLKIYTVCEASELAKQLVKFGAGFVSKTKLYGDLKRIENRIQEIESVAFNLGNKVACAHFHSARNSLDNIRMGNDAEMEIRAAIHHLYDAYNVGYDLLDKKLSFDQYLFCSKMAILISALHLYLNESEIAEQWYKRAEEGYCGAQEIYDNSVEFQKKMFALLNVFIDENYFNKVNSLIKNTPFSQYRVITKEQYIAFGSQYAFIKDFMVGIGVFKKSLFKAYFLTPKGHRMVNLKLEHARQLIDKRHIANMIEEHEKAISKYDELTDTWDEIFANIKNGTYKTKYKIGDKKTCDFSSEGSIVMQIADFDRDERTDGKGMAAITWIGVQCLNTKQVMGNTVTSWKKSDLREYLNNFIFELLPLSLKNNIVSVWKNGGVYATYKEPTEDKIWIPSFNEVYGKDNYKIFTQEYDLSSSWWLRTPEIVDWSKQVGYFYYYDCISNFQEMTFDEQLKRWSNAKDSLPCYVSGYVLPCFCI